jgi:glycine cleavage system transcriptional repressor
MQNYLALTAIGQNRPDLVQAFSKTIRDCGLTIVDSRMAVLGDVLCMMMLLSGSWDSVAKIESMQARLEDQHKLTITTKRTEQRKKASNLMPYAVEVVSPDQIGIVHEISHFFTHRDINIEELFSGAYAAAHTGTPMFSLHLTISVPTDVSIAALRGEFMDFCDHLNLDAIMEPVK